MLRSRHTQSKWGREEAGLHCAAKPYRNIPPAGMLKDVYHVWSYTLRGFMILFLQDQCWSKKKAPTKMPGCLDPI